MPQKYKSFAIGVHLWWLSRNSVDAGLREIRFAASVGNVAQTKESAVVSITGSCRHDH